MAEDMFTMQQEAIRRAREMHSRAIPPVPSGSSSRERQASPDSRRDTSGKNSNDPGRNQQGTSQENHSSGASRESSGGSPDSGSAAPMPTGDPLSVFFKDKDKTIILALILLLSGEDGDQSLLLALLYLLM